MKRVYLFFALSCVSSAAIAQSAIDAYRMSQPDLRGTARFMGMGGAFGALGGDLSTLSQNPAGIGVYRSNEVGFTVDLDAQRATSQAQGYKSSVNLTKFYLDNIGGVATLRLGSNSVPNLNFGFTYNKGASFNRRYKGGISNIGVSMTNYIAGIANNDGLSVGDVSYMDGYDPYNPTDGGKTAPWLTILGFYDYLINPNGNAESPTWTGQFGEGTTGSAGFDIDERGSIDEYNIAIGGNIANKVFWGMNFDITSLSYSLDALYGESLQNAYVANKDNVMGITDSQWNIRNLYTANGQGFNYQLGVIVKPIQELRFGLAFHTPTYYNITETYKAQAAGKYYGETVSESTNGGVPGSQSYNFSSPWKVIASVAGVIGNKFILSADYEWNSYRTMKFSVPENNYYGGGGWDWDYGWDFSVAPKSVTPKAISNDPYAYENQDIKDIYRNTSSFRVGAEYRVTPNFSLRAGYSFVASPVEAKAKNNQMTIYTAGTIPDYRLDNTTNYVTAGLGYRNKGFYIDLAYVYKHMSSEYHAFTPDPSDLLAPPSPQAKVDFSNSRVVLSAGFKF